MVSADERTEKGFMNIQRLSLSLIALLTCCKQDLTDDAIPYVPFSDIVITLNLPQYTDLNSKGWVYVDGGVQGIILYKSGNTYLAYERNCSFHPINNVGAIVYADVSNRFMIDHSCNSSFNFEEGTPTGGPAWRPLRRYKTFLDGTELTITDESANGM
jgi:nitrite reductase/ring-hydroxylating ferredoxin subunit